MVMLETLKRYLGNGWVEADETWTYVSTDDPTGVFKVNADVTGKYSVGMRIKMTNGGNTIYGIITKVGIYEGDEAGYTYITFLHEIDPTDSQALTLMGNSAITLPYFSSQKAPYGFPTDPRKWSILVTDITERSQASPTVNVWYNLNNSNIVLPIGVWDIDLSCVHGVQKGTADYLDVYTTLSTANNSESSTSNSLRSSMGIIVFILNHVSKRLRIMTTSKTTYYVNTKTPTSGTNPIYRTHLVLRATCAYL